MSTYEPVQVFEDLNKSLREDKTNVVQESINYDKNKWKCTFTFQQKATDLVNVPAEEGKKEEGEEAEENETIEKVLEEAKVEEIPVEDTVLSTQVIVKLLKVDEKKIAVEF